MTTKDTNIFLDVLGNPGRYGWVIFSLLCLNYFPVAFNHLVMSIYGAVPPHRCRLPDHVTADNDSIPETDGGKLDQCHVYANYTYMNGQEVGCPDGWVYTLLEGDSTIVSEWDLVCDNKYLSSLSTTIYFTGVMVGGLVCGPIADITGRRPMMIVTMYLPVLLGIMVYLVQSVPLFMLLRFCIGIMMQGIQISSYVLAAELCSTSKNRAYTAALFECCWGLAVMTLAAIAYIFRDWRSIQLGITLPTMLTLVWVWVLPESLRWMLHRRRYNDSLKYMKRAARFNKVTITPEIEQELRNFCPPEKNAEAEEKRYAIWDAFRTPNIRKHTFIMFYVWLATSMGYYGLSMQASRFTGNKYLNFFINDAIELPAYLAGVWILSMNAGVGTCAFWARVGGIIAPQINLTADYSKSWIPIVVFGCVLILGGLLTLLLPETRDLSFPDTLEEAEDLGKRSKARDKNGSANEAYDDERNVEPRDPALNDVPLGLENKDVTRL